jgi:hypothetical protein
MQVDYDPDKTQLLSRLLKRYRLKKWSSFF